MKRLTGVAAMLLALGGCASLPDDLSVPEGQARLAFSDARTTPASGQTALWGGEVAAVRNLEHGSQVEVVQFELSSNGYPLRSDESGGRFRIEVQTFIDPAIYTEGRVDSARGQFDRHEDVKIDQRTYSFPILKAEDIHLWPEVKDPPVCDCDLFWGNSLMHRPVIVVPVRP